MGEFLVLNRYKNGAIVNYAPAVLSGCGLALCFPTWCLYPIAWIALIPLLIQTWEMKPAAAARTFFIAGLAFNLILLQWLLSNMYWAGGWAVWGYAGLCVIMAGYWAGTAAVWRLTTLALPRVPPWATLAVLWFAMETLQARLLTGFGWGALGYSQGPDLWFAQWAAIGGVSLLSFILVIVNGMAAHAYQEDRLRMPLVLGAIGVIVMSHAVGGFLIHEPDYESEPYAVGVIQPDYPLETKWDREYTLDMVETAAEKSRMLVNAAGPVDLVVWPEAHVMTDLDRPGILPTITELARDLDAHIYTGAHRSSMESLSSFNSSYLFDSAGDVSGQYDKVHLAPFGEYVPLSRLLPFIAKVVPAIGDIDSGTEQTTLKTDAKTLGPLICFEVLFAPMAESLRGAGADMLVVITNLAWFGSSNAIPQELEIARLRAIETRLPLIHCANTGVSGVFDPWGRFDDVDLYVGAGGPIEHPDLPQAAKTMQRFAGRFPVAAPGQRPIPGGPVYTPWIATAASLLLLIVGLWRRFGPAPVSNVAP